MSSSTTGGSNREQPVESARKLWKAKFKRAKAVLIQEAMDGCNDCDSDTDEMCRTHQLYAHKLEDDPRSVPELQELLNVKPLDKPN